MVYRYCHLPLREVAEGRAWQPRPRQSPQMSAPLPRQHEHVSFTFTFVIPVSVPLLKRRMLNLKHEV